jgi:SpoIID/LytB domain protein
MISEPSIAVGLVEDAAEVGIRLLDDYRDDRGTVFTPGDYRFSCRNGSIVCDRAPISEATFFRLTGTRAASRFRLQITIGIDFHWQQRKEHTFSGALRLLKRPGERLTVINDVPLEAYILSVSCSEMNAASPEEFLKAHSIISRSWLLAQLAAKENPVAAPGATGDAGEIIRWYDRQSHAEFDVCADDHCQRYQGTDMITTGEVARAVESTRGIILSFEGKPCDARFSKCCGGVTEDFRAAWSDDLHPYLVPVADAPDTRLPQPPLTDATAAHAFITAAPEAYCNCSDPAILRRVLNNYDQTTGDFYRWKVRLTHSEMAALLLKKLSIDIGRPLALEPLERGLSGRITRLKIRGDAATVTIGKELEIRRALSATHLYSSAFIVETEGDPKRPDTFVLRGAGWGHGVGLCQIGAAVMACRGIGYQDILRHYYPGSTIGRLY